MACALNSAIRAVKICEIWVVAGAGSRSMEWRPLIFQTISQVTGTGAALRAASRSPARASADTLRILTSAVCSALALGASLCDCGGVAFGSDHGPETLKSSDQKRSSRVSKKLAQLLSVVFSAGPPKSC